jgi:5-methyltetrahydrofolate--homocysteine methyltransferase
LEVVIEQMHEADPDVVLVAKANAGLPHMVGDMAVYDATPALMADYARHVRKCGARIIGACCGSTPDHIAAIAEALKGKDAA